MQAVGNLNENQNPRPMMTAAFIFIILSFVVGIPIIITVAVVRAWSLLRISYSI